MKLNLLAFLKQKGPSEQKDKSRTSKIFGKRQKKDLKRREYTESREYMRND